MTVHSPLDAPSGLNSATGEVPTPDAGPVALKASPRFGFPLPFDPVRLLAGVLSRWPWIVIGMLVAGSLGSLVGMRLTHPSFTLSVSLLKRRVPHTVQTSEVGQAYRPVDLNDATLHATLLASEPLDLALRRSANGTDPNRIRTLVEAKQLEGTDIFYITYHSPISAADAVAFSTIWAEEINAYTQRLQQTEAREVRLILQKEVTDLELELSKTNLEILNFSKDKDYLGGEAQVAAALAKLAQIELELETARTTATAKAEQLKNLTAQIHRQSPLELQLRTAKEELANLRATYTDANPLVQAKLQSIEYLGGQIEKLNATGDTDLDSYTGTPLGNQLYLSILTLRNEHLEATSKIQALEKLNATALARIEEFPAIVSSYEAMKEKRDAIRGGLSLMSNRLREAEIFASGAPGYWQVFQAPDPRSIVPSSLLMKPVILGVGGGMLGAGLAVLLTLLFTQRTSRRSILECCAATRAPLLACIPTTRDEDAQAAVEHLWITHLAPRLTPPKRILCWAAALEPADERCLWTMLAAAAHEDTGKSLRIHDLTPDSLWGEAACPPAMEWLVEPPSNVPPSRPIAATFLRAARLPQGETRKFLAPVDFWMAAVTGQREALRRAARLRSLTDAYLPRCDGTIGWTERPANRIRKAADVISGLLAKRFSKLPTP
ncbi:MAG: hypothetical protein NTW21_32525 [Verrucomicrobia bacterium]|nr:hypothetical protein [Verrucomicrobiota bacterium]